MIERYLIWTLSALILIAAIWAGSAKATVKQPSECQLTAAAVYAALTTPGAKVKDIDRPVVDLGKWLYHHADSSRRLFLQWYGALCKHGEAPRGYRLVGKLLMIPGDTRGSI